MKFSYYFVAANRAEVCQRMQPWQPLGSHLIVSCLWALQPERDGGVAEQSAKIIADGDWDWDRI